MNRENAALRRARAAFDEGAVAFAARLVVHGLRPSPFDDSSRDARAAVVAARLGGVLCVRTLARARTDESAALPTRSGGTSTTSCRSRLAASITPKGATTPC